MEILEKLNDQSNISIVSLNNANTELKKIIPMIIDKQLYNEQKKQNKEKTTHLIIDEAHNILSEKITIENEGNRNLRLSLFKEITKEGRKFGFFLTISSQRPSDISSTIVSQLHNFFIHRLVSEMDLEKIKNSINEIDALSLKKIPTLESGQCILSGTAF